MPERCASDVLARQWSPPYWKSLAERQQDAARREDPLQAVDVTLHRRGGGDVTRLTETMRGCLSSVCVPVCRSVRLSVCLAQAERDLSTLAVAEVAGRGGEGGGGAGETDGSQSMEAQTGLGLLFLEALKGNQN